MKEVVINMKIQVIAIKDMPDGSMSCDVDYDDEAGAQIKLDFGVDEITPEILTQVVTRALETYLAIHSEKLEAQDAAGDKEQE